MGFEVRARIDPIMVPDGWEAAYEGFFHEMAHEHGIRPTMLTLGSHREKMPQLDAFRAYWGLPSMEFEPEKTKGREGTHIHMVGRDHVYAKVRQLILAAFSGYFIAHWFRMRQGPYVSRGEFLSALGYAWDRPLLQRVK